MASIKPRKRNRGDSGLKELDADMQRAFSMKMGQLKRLKRDVHEEDPDSGVIYVSHIPHGFYEPQMKKFFTQFGNVKRLRLSRSKKSGQSKGYAYVEFEFSEVAKVVSETMHNYLMYQKLLKCFYVPKDKLHADTFKGCFHHFKNPRRREIAAARNNGLLESGKEHILESTKRRVSGLTKKQKKLEQLGIDFKIEGVESEWQRLKESQPPAPKVTAVKRTPASKVTGRTSDSRKRPARKSDKKTSAKRRRRPRPLKKGRKIAAAPVEKEDVASKSIKQAGPIKADAASSGQSTPKEKGIKKGARSSARLSSKVKSAKSLRTSVKKKERLST